MTPAFKAPGKRGRDWVIPFWDSVFGAVFKILLRNGYYDVVFHIKLGLLGVLPTGQ